MTLEGNHEWAFLMPLCFTEVGYFDRFLLSVSSADAQKIEEMGPKARMKQLADDGKFMVTVLEMAHVLVQGGQIRVPP